MNADCPYDYFVPELKEKYYSLLEKGEGSEPDCKTASRDVAGTIAGAWFQGDANEERGPRFGISKNTFGLSSMVDIKMIRSDEMRISLRDSSGDVIGPETITIGKSVCYYDHDTKMYAYLKLLTDLEMGLAVGDGECPSNFPTQYELWVR